MEWSREYQDLLLIVIVSGMAAVFIMGVTIWQKRDLAKHRAAPASAAAKPAAAGGWTYGDGAGGPYVGCDPDVNAYGTGDGGDGGGGGASCSSGDGGD